MCDAGRLPCDPNKRDLLATDVVDQRHANVLQREDDFLFGQLRLLGLTEHLVDALLLGEQHHALEPFGLLFRSQVTVGYSVVTVRVQCW